MRWSWACAVGLLFVAVAPACSSSSSDPTGDTCAPVTPLKKAAETGCACDGQCETGLTCFKGNMQAFCTIHCDATNATTVCVAPYTGTCNKQGLCKRD